MRATLLFLNCNKKWARLAIKYKIQMGKYNGTVDSYFRKDWGNIS